MKLIMFQSVIRSETLFVIAYYNQRIMQSCCSIAFLAGMVGSFKVGSM